MFKTFPQLMAELPKSRMGAWHTVTLPWGATHSVFVRGTDDAQMAPSPKRAAKMKGDFASRTRFAEAPAAPTRRAKGIRFARGIRVFEVEA